jgi:hypothetical protein
MRWAGDIQKAIAPRTQIQYYLPDLIHRDIPGDLGNSALLKL